MGTARLHKAVCADLEITVDTATPKGTVKLIGEATLGVAQRTANSGSKCVFATKAGPVWKHTVSGTTGSGSTIGDWAYVYSASGNVTSIATGNVKIGTFHTAVAAAGIDCQVQVGL